MDAAGTVAYDGTTPRLDIYAKPAATTTYSAVSLLNGCYSDPATVNVIVNNPASIADNTIPADVAVCEFGTAKFEVSAAGSNLTYQWQTDKGTGAFTDIADDGNYSGATTDSLSVKNMPRSWNGYKYHCVVSSTAPCTASVNSRDAVLTVNPTPVVTLEGSPTSLLPGMVTTLSVSSTPPAATYSWIKNNAPFDDATGSSFNATIDDQGVYQVAIVDVNGCAATSNPLEISDSVSAKLFIYPNPSENRQFSVSYYSIKGNTLPRILTIYDSKGALVLKSTSILS